MHILTDDGSLPAQPIDAKLLAHSSKSRMILGQTEITPVLFQFFFSLSFLTDVVRPKIRRYRRLYAVRPDPIVFISLTVFTQVTCTTTLYFILLLFLGASWNLCPDQRNP